MKKIILLILPLFFLFPTIEASHIVGGDLSIQWVSANNYRIKLRMYRDDVNGAVPMPSNVTIGVYDAVTHTQVATQLLQSTSLGLVALGDTCWVPDPNTIRIEEGIFESLVDLFIPDNPNGYYVSTQVFARNALASNVQINGTLVWFAMMSDPAIGQNSSPDFGNYPADTYFCRDSTKITQYPIIDADGDSLAYSLVEPFDASTSTTGSFPGIGIYPYYPSLVWQAGYSLANIVGGTPTMSIDASTGIISATPSLIGFYTFAVRVEEFRDLGSGIKVKIGETRRDIQYPAYNNCPINIITTVTTNIDTLISNHPFILGGASYQWFDCDNGYAVIPGAINQSYVPTANGNYAVEITNCTGTDTSACVNFFLTGIEESNNIIFNISPNPVKEILNINIKTSDILQVKIIDIAGKTIKSFTQSNKTINVGDLSQGIYFLQIESNKGISINKFVKE